VIFDERLTGLDPAGIQRMEEVMLRLARDAAAIIASSHLLTLLEAVCTHLLILKNGKKMADGSVAEVHAHFSDGAAASLEDVCLRATSDPEATSASWAESPCCCAPSSICRRRRSSTSSIIVCASRLPDRRHRSP
jgi:ABC-type multidrug transport system ATPase subunit